jgi:hypothetical protein
MEHNICLEFLFKMPAVYSIILPAAKQKIFKIYLLIPSYLFVFIEILLKIIRQFSYIYVK